jgi:hypothetical protein
MQGATVTGGESVAWYTCDVPVCITSTAHAEALRLPTFAEVRAIADGYGWAIGEGHAYCPVHAYLVGRASESPGVQ